MSGLLGNLLEPLQLPMQGADVLHVPSFIDNVESERFLADLLRQTPWRQEAVVVWGKEHDQPRLVAWYGDEHAAYSYSKLSLLPHPWTESLNSLRNRVSEFCGSTFNSVLLNLYRNGLDRMGWHSDDEPELGIHPLIASLSFGADRVFKFRPKPPLDAKPMRLQLRAGDLLLMGGDTQKNWQHAIDKEPYIKTARINLTFRTIYKKKISWNAAPK